MSQASANKNLLIRIISAALLAPPVVLLVLWQRPFGFAILVHLASAIGLAEFYWIVLKDDPLWMRIFGIALGTLVSITMFWCPRPDAAYSLLVLSSIFIATFHVSGQSDLKKATVNIGLMVFGLLYIPTMLTYLALFKKFQLGSEWIFLVLTITWLSDTGAYFVGRFLGQHKLCPAISPKKTIEGAIGGLFSSFGAAVLAKFWYLPQLTWIDVIVLSIPGSLLGQIGDLIESMFKRAFQVKDSGWIIPGHGGLLDRIDALLFVCPYVYFYFGFVQK